MKVINFYRANDPYGYLSNFYRASFLLNKKVWPTSEHYFQAQKFIGTPYEEKIRGATTAAESAKLGRSREVPLRPDWEEVKEKVMIVALRAKFAQNLLILEKLLATDDATLVEHTVNDAYWGDGGNGKGFNRLGVLLMRVREEFRPLYGPNLPSFSMGSK